MEAMMKKKIKDLTFDEKDKLCKKSSNICFACPLYKVKNACKLSIYKSFSELEVEVDE